MTRLKFYPVLLLAAAWAVLISSLPLWAQTRLYLTNGTYLLVTQYSIQGNRVRYYSVADSQWEEMPVSLVDWKATHQSEQQKKLKQQRILKEAAETTRPSYKMPPNAGYAVAPGVRLPVQAGIYTYDGIRLVTLLRSQCSVVRDKKRMVLRMALPGPLLKGRALAILPGSEATVHFFLPDPAFYAQFAGGEGSTIVLLRVERGKQDRTVEKLDAGRGGKMSESRTVLPLKVTQIHPGLVKLTPATPLSPGEYALGEISENKLNLDVWDFGIDSPNEQEAKGKKGPSFLHKVLQGAAAGSGH
jgi:hypothetical protein